MSQSRWENVLGRIRLYKDWYKVVLPLNRVLAGLGVRPTLHLRNGLRFKVRIFSDDLPIIYEVIARDSYGLQALTLGERPVVVDIGGNIGVFSAAVHRLYPGAQITVFEPHPENFALLQCNAPFAQLEQKAVAGSAGEVHIEASGHASALKLSHQGIAVPAVTLEQVLAPFRAVDLLKVDIEGSEYEVFTHASPALMTKVHQVIVEVHRDTWRGWFENYLYSCGFTTRWDKDLLIAKK